MGRIPDLTNNVKNSQIKMNNYLMSAAVGDIDKLAFLDRDVEAISFRFYHDDWHEPRPLLLKSDVH